MSVENVYDEYVEDENLKWFDCPVEELLANEEVMPFVGYDLDDEIHPMFARY